jgi:N-acetylneuraminate synthase
VKSYNYKPCIVVSELCCNHQGKIDIAKEMILQSKLAGADYCKFQKRNVEEYYDKWNYDYNSDHSFGKTYYEHRKFLEFSIKQHKELKKYCDKIKIKYTCSVWDIKSAEEIISLDPDYIKIPSAMNENYQLLDFIFKNYKKDVHISLGMITKKNRNKLFNYLKVKDKKDRIVLYWTTSGYPVKFDELFLLEINNIKNKFSRVGYSAHNLGIAMSSIVYTLRCEYIEHHFTLDRTLKGTDQAASLEPGGLQKLCRDLKAAYKALQYKNIDLTKDEIKNSDKLKIKTNL